MPCDDAFQAEGRCGTRTVDCEQFIDKATSVEHCGSCGNTCEFDNASPTCKAGNCQIDSCDDGFKDLTDAPGCECEVTEEICDGKDNDCDGEIDETFKGRDDQPNLGDACNAGASERCQGQIVCGDDQESVVCEASESPSQEVCDRIDNDCDGEIDEGFGDQIETLYRDRDGDGKGRPDTSKTFCTGDGEPSGWVSNQEDECDTPSATDAPPYLSWTQTACNECGDNDGDGFYADCDTYDDSHPGGDCNDDEQVVNPQGDEVCDTLDRDCSGSPHKRRDPNDPDAEVPVTKSCGSDTGQCQSGTQTCMMQNGQVSFGECQGEIEPSSERGPRRCDGLDNDCDQQTDERATSDDTTCDGIDDDCDGQVDEDTTPLKTCSSPKQSSDGVCGQFPLGLECQNGDRESCQDKIDRTVSYQAPETGCDGKDNDCDGDVDENPTDPDAVYAGNNFTCTVSNTGVAHCWGDDTHGQLGDGSASPNNPQTAPDNEVAGQHTFKTLALGDVHTCGLVLSRPSLDEGDVYCWGSSKTIDSGSGVVGRLGIRSQNPSIEATPRQVASSLKFVDVAAGRNHTCAVAESGSVYCWGGNQYGQLGDGTTTGTRQPFSVSANASISFESVTAGQWHTCALDQQGRAYCWGRNHEGQLGVASKQNTVKTPTEVASPAGAKGRLTYSDISSASGSNVTCALREPSQTPQNETNAYCWGTADLLGSGRRNPQPSNRPVAVAGQRTYVELDVGRAHACAVRNPSLRRETFCWGAGGKGQLGTGGTPQRALSPMSAQQIAVDNISAGGSHSCGIVPLSPSEVKCWGANAAGQLGRSDTRNTTTPKTYRCPSAIP